MCLKTSW
jgi:hypothetical protein